MGIANYESTLDKVVQFINAGLTMVTVYHPISDEGDGPRPIAHAAARDQTLVWQSGGERPVAEQVQYVERRSDSEYRVVLDARYDLELHISRADTAHHKRECEEFKKAFPRPHPETDDILEHAIKRKPWSKRETDYYFSRWFRGDDLMGVVACGDDGMIFVPSSDKHRTAMKSLERHYGDFSWYRGIENGRRILEDLFESPTIGREVTAPEFLKASDLIDAGQLARNIAVGEFRRSEA